MGGEGDFGGRVLRLLRGGGVRSWLQYCHCVRNDSRVPTRDGHGFQVNVGNAAETAICCAISMDFERRLTDPTSRSSAWDMIQMAVRTRPIPAADIFRKSGQSRGGCAS